MNLGELARRCEAATGGNTDTEIAVRRTIENVIHDIMPEPKVVQPLKYCSSLDAALSLVPEGWHAIIHARPDYPGVELFEFPLPCRKVPLVHADTPALALCAAALRARAETEPQPAPQPAQVLTPR